MIFMLKEKLYRVIEVIFSLNFEIHFPTISGQKMENKLKEQKATFFAQLPHNKAILVHSFSAFSLINHRKSMTNAPITSGLLNCRWEMGNWLFVKMLQ